jgi:8-oxo-dGTP pyrophosphatase MutT (NUDIX family)
VSSAPTPASCPPGYARSATPSSDVSAGLRPDAAPGWLVPLVAATTALTPEVFGGQQVPTHGGRRAAVLMLFGHGGSGPDLLLQQRAECLRAHAGQVSFPGGAVDPGDGGPVDTALREAAEETGLNPAGVDPLVLFPEIFIPPSGYLVTPVLAHWREPVAVAAVDKAETASVVRVPVADLADPGNRIVVRHPSGWVGPAFEVAGMVVWGFTGALVDGLLRLGGWERPWSVRCVRESDQVVAATEVDLRADFLRADLQPDFRRGGPPR